MIWRLLLDGIEIARGSYTADLNLDETMRVTSQKVLGREIAEVLEDEQEDGTTLVHEMLDRAINFLAEHVSESIVERKGEER